MKKLYRRRGTVHPSPPTISDHLSFLPAAILALAAALSPGDRQVLAYLISSTDCSGHRCKASAKGGPDHPPVFNCDCFRCYTSYWIRWDASPNRQLIHEIIDAYEEGLAQTRTSKNNRKERKKRSTGSGFESGPGPSEGNGSEANSRSRDPEPRPRETEAATESGGGGEDETEKGSVRKIVSFIGERIWGAWN